MVGIYLKEGKPHTHEADLVDIQVTEVVRNIRQRLEDNPNAAPAAVFGNIAGIRNEEVIASLPQRAGLLRTINRVQNRHRSQNP